MSAQHSSNGFKNDDWELIIKEALIVSCEIEPETDVFDVLKDERINNFQAEIHAISMRNYINKKMNKCEDLGDNLVLAEWLRKNEDAMTGSDYSIKNFIADKMMASGAETIEKTLIHIQYLLELEYKNIEKTYGIENNCDFDFSFLVDLNSLSPFNKVYRSFVKPFGSTKSQGKYWEAVVEANNQ